MTNMLLITLVLICVQSIFGVIGHVLAEGTNVLINLVLQSVLLAMTAAHQQFELSNA